MERIEKVREWHIYLLSRARKSKIFYHWHCPTLARGGYKDWILPVTGLNFCTPLNFCVVGPLENLQRRVVDGNVEVHFQMVLAITTTFHVPATQNRFSADLDLLAVISFSVQPDDERTLVVSAVDTMYPFYEGEWVRGIRTATCDYSVVELGIKDVEGGFRVPQLQQGIKGTWTITDTQFLQIGHVIRSIELSAGIFERVKGDRHVEVGTNAEIRRLSFLQDRPRIVLDDSKATTFLKIPEPLPHRESVVDEAMMEEKYRVESS